MIVTGKELVQRVWAVVCSTVPIITTYLSIDSALTELNEVFKNQDIKLGGYRIEDGSKRNRGSGDYDQNTKYEILKELIEVCIILKEKTCIS